MPEGTHLLFALALHEALGPPGVDSCVSPYSVATALSLLAAGARGRTRDELCALLGEPAEVAELAVAASQLVDDAAESPVIAVTTTLWAADRLAIRPEFVAAAQSWPAAAVRSAPFATDPEGARERINAEVCDTTRELIPELLGAGTIDRSTFLALVNAVYLRTNWAEAFSAPAPGPFRAPSGSRWVPTMVRRGQLRYVRRGAWRAVALPAAGGVEALVLLPRGELADAEAGLDEEVLRDLLDALRPTEVRLIMPTVDLDVRSDLDAALRALGVRTLFTGAADLGGICPDPGTGEITVAHRAVLRLDEHGLEGAAATAVVAYMVAMEIDRPDPVVMRVDRPFLLLVRHVATGAVYFLARVVEPGSSGGPG